MHDSRGRQLAAVCAALDAEASLINRAQVGGVYDSRTLLMAAASKGHVAIVQELLRRGADVTTCDKRGADAMSLAQKQGHEPVANVLTNFDPSQSLSQALHAPEPSSDVSPTSKRPRREERAIAGGSSGSVPFASIFQQALNGQVRWLPRAREGSPPRTSVATADQPCTTHVAGSSQPCARLWTRKQA